MKQIFSLEEILAAVDGQLIIGSDYKMDKTVYIEGVSKDSRTIQSGEMFVALVGENFDGHSFCSKALEKGAALLLISDASFLPTTSLAVLVDDTYEALSKLARRYRFKLANNGTKVIGITGNSGLSCTREMISSALSKSLNVYATKNSVDSKVELPMTILSAPLDSDVLVLEMGMKAKGDVSALTQIACPDIAIISNLSDDEEMIREDLLTKCEILEGLVPGGVLAINGDNNKLTGYIKENVSFAYVVATANVMDNPSASGFAVSVKAKNLEDVADGTKFDVVVNYSNTSVEISNVVVNSKEDMYVRDAIFAFVCSAILKADYEATKDGIASYKIVSEC